MERVESSDKLVFLYLFNSQITTDSEGQDMTLLNKLFYSVLKELKYGYVTTYAFDCSIIENSSSEADANIK